MAKETITAKDVGKVTVGKDGQPRIVEATGNASGTGTGPQPKPETGKVMGRAIEEAMNGAIQKAAEEGVSDAGEIKKRVLAAREKAAADFEKRGQEQQQVDQPAPPKK